MNGHRRPKKAPVAAGAFDYESDGMSAYALSRRIGSTLAMFGFFGAIGF